MAVACAKSSRRLCRVLWARRDGGGRGRVRGAERPRDLRQLQRRRGRVHEGGRRRRLCPTLLRDGRRR